MFYLRFLEEDFDSANAKIAGMFPQFLSALTEEMNRQLAILQEMVLANLEGEVLWSRTHQLASSVQTELATVVGNYIEGYVRAGGDDSAAPYAWFFEDPSIGGTGGTAPHEIVARNASALHFNWASHVAIHSSGGVSHATAQELGPGAYGQEAFFAHVDHPGFSERPFMSEAWQAWIGDLPAAVQNVVDLVVSDAMAA
jgi:hypothetical protein